MLPHISPFLLAFLNSERFSEIVFSGNRMCFLAGKFHPTSELGERNGSMGEHSTPILRGLPQRDHARQLAD